MSVVLQSVEPWVGGGERVNLDNLHIALTRGVMETRLTAPEWEEGACQYRTARDNREGGAYSSRNCAPVDCMDVSTVLEQNRNRPGVALPARDYHTTLREPWQARAIAAGGQRRWARTVQSGLAVGVEAIDGSPVLEHALDYVFQLVQRLCQVPKPCT
jgi:hypothetical protein